MIALALFFLPIPGASLPTFDGHPPFDESEGMRSLFGHYEANSGSAKFTVPDNSAFDLNGSGFKAGDELVVRPFWKSFRPGANADYYDMYAVLRGTDYDYDNDTSRSVHNVSGVEIFRFSEGSYTRISRRGSVTSTEQAIGTYQPSKVHSQ